MLYKLGLATLVLLEDVLEALSKLLSSFAPQRISVYGPYAKYKLPLNNL